MINITSKGDELLETRLNEATNPLNPTLNMVATDAFCDQILKEPEGCQIAVRLLAHKVQSPQEKEALYSFAVIDECVKKCGSRFHQEVGKFRFLNELIKVISPKYLALHMSPAVKKRCIECLYALYKGIPNEPKLTEAYNMLKKQNIISRDPTYMDDKIFKVSQTCTERTKSIFENSKDSERLSKLLKSRNADDLREANRIIKNLVQADNNRIEQLSKRQMELETMRNNIELLGEMLTHHMPGEDSSDDLFIMKELVDNLEKSRSEMFKLSRETDDDECLNEIIKVIDECNVIIKTYWDKMSPGNNSKSAVKKAEGDLIGVDLLGDSMDGDLLTKDLHSIGIHDNLVKDDSTVPESSGPMTKYDELMDLFQSQNTGSSGLTLPINEEVRSNNVSNHTISKSTMFTGEMKPNINPNRTLKVEYKGFEDLDILGQEMFNLNKKSNSLKHSQSQDVDLLSSLEDKQLKDSSLNDHPLLCNDLGFQNTLSSPPDESLSLNSLTSATEFKVVSILDEAAIDVPSVDLNSIHVNLSTIKPHPLKLPMVIYTNDESKVKIVLHFAADRPHPNVSVLVAQVASQNNFPVSDIVLKFAVSKPMKVRKLPANTDTLPGHSPFTPSIPINEVVLLFNPTHDAATLKYQLSYEINGDSFLESSHTESINF